MKTEHYLQAHVRLKTTDLDEAREVCSKLWEYHRSELRHGRQYRIDWRQADLVQTHLSYIHNYSVINVDCGAIGNRYHLHLHESGTLNHWIDGRVTTSTPTRAVLYGPGQTLQLETRPFRALLLSFERDFVDTALVRRFGWLPPPATWTTDALMAASGAIALRSLCRWVGGELDRPGTPLRSSPRTLAAMERAMLNLLLDCLAEHHPAVDREAGDLSAQQFAQIEEWLDVHFADPIGVEDMARVAGVSVRALQSAFRRARGCTPTQAILRRRLDHARLVLSARPPTQQLPTWRWRRDSSTLAASQCVIVKHSARVRRKPWPPHGVATAEATVEIILAGRRSYPENVVVECFAIRIAEAAKRCNPLFTSSYPHPGKSSAEEMGQGCRAAPLGGYERRDPAPGTVGLAAVVGGNQGIPVARCL